MNRSEVVTASAVLWCSAGERGRHIPPEVQQFLLGARGRDALHGEISAAIRRGWVVQEGELLKVNASAPEMDLAMILSAHEASAPTVEHIAALAAVGNALGLPADAGSKEILAAASAISVREIHEFPERVYAAHLTSPEVRKAAQSAQAAVRRALVAVGSSGACAMIFPACWASSLGEQRDTVVAALRRCFFDEVTPTYSAIVTRSRLPQKAVQAIVAQLESSRVLVRVDNVRGKGRVPHILNLRGLQVDQVSLADVVRYHEADAGPSGDQKRGLRSALRQHLGLPRTASPEDLIEASRTILVHQLHSLPREVIAGSRARGSDERTARNYGSAVRTAISRAAEAGIIPLVFPVAWLQDPWAVTKEEWLGTKFPGIGYNARLFWGYAAAAARDLLGPNCRPQDLAPGDVERLATWWRARGDRHRATHIRSLFRSLGERGLGPLADQEEEKIEPWYLYGPDRGAPETRDAVLAMFQHHGLQQEWEEFWAWYWRWSTVDDDVLDLEEEDHPTRPEKRELSVGTLVRRCYGLRLLLGISKHHMNVDLATLSLTEALGYDHVRKVIAHARRVWKERAKRGELSTDVGGALKGYVLAIGMLAEALYRRQRHQRGERDESRTGTDKRTMRTRQQELGQEMTHLERQLWDAYEYCQAKAEQLEKKAMKVGPSNSLNVERDLRRIIENTPGSFWVALLERWLKHARRSIESGHWNQRHHRLIRNVYLTGLAVSTGFRWEELAHIRLDIQYLPAERAKLGDRYIELRAEDRKNKRAHRGVVREQFVPHWLEDHYLAVTRPSLMEALSSEEQHTHLLVSMGGNGKPPGLPYGDPRERRDGSGRDWHRLDFGKNSLRRSWQEASGKFAWKEFGQPIPTGHGEWSGHVLRTSMGHAIFQTARASDLNPVAAAANYLGDRPESVFDVYATIGAEFLDPAIFQQLRGIASEMNAQGTAMQSGDAKLKQEVEAKNSELQMAEAKIRSLEEQIRALQTQTTAPEIQAEVQRQIAVLLTNLQAAPAHVG